MAHTTVSAATRDLGPDTAGRGQAVRRGVSRLLSLDRRGASAVEFALVLPLLMVLLTGVIQFGWVFFIQLSMENAAREGARQLAVGSVNVGGSSGCPATSGSAEDIACNALDGLGGLTFTLAACDPSNANATLCPNSEDVAVQVSIPRNQLAIADLLGLFNTTDVVVALVTMRKEG